MRLPNWETVLDEHGRPCLKYPFHPSTDWLPEALGAVPSQPDGEGSDHPIAFASRLLSPAESHYAPTEGECCGLIWANEKFRHNLHGYYFQLNRYHKSLEWLSTARFTNSKLERWALRLQEFNFTVNHVRGEDNVVADCLSRACAATLLSLPVIAASWPAHAKSQADLDAIPCEICHAADAWDNMVICDGCDRCMHLRCLIPPQTTAPSGKFYCPACDVGFNNSVAELADPNTPLQYNSSHDPHTYEALLQYLRSGRQETFLPMDCRPRQALLDLAAKVRLHMRYDGWLGLPKKDWTQCLAMAVLTTCTVPLGHH